MRTRQIKVCDAIHIKVDCAINDPVDIRAGGPAVLGYDFYVSPDVKINTIITTIKKFLKKYNRPLMDISHYVHKDFNVESLWTVERIEQCIKEHSVE
jgi:hypothetical protein